MVAWLCRLMWPSSHLALASTSQIVFSGSTTGIAGLILSLLAKAGRVVFFRGG